MIKSTFNIARLFNNLLYRRAERTYENNWMLGFPTQTVLICLSLQTLMMYLKYLSAQFRCQLEMIDQVTLLGQWDAVSAFVVGLHVEDHEFAIVMGG